MVTLIIFQMISARLFEPLPNVLQTAVGKSHLFESFMIIEFVFFFGGGLFYYADSESGRAKSRVGKDPVPHGAVQETSTNGRQMKPNSACTPFSFFFQLEAKLPQNKSDM